MYPCGNDNSLLLLVDLIGHSVSDGEVLTLVSSNGSAKSVPGHIVELSRLDLTEVLIQVRVSVWLRIGEVDLVIIMFKSMGESEGVVASLKVSHLVRVLFVVILEIAQVLTTSCPTLLEFEFLLAGTVTISSLLDPFLPFLRVDKNFHALVVETLSFDHVEHIELYSHSLLDVGNSEEEPLSVAFRVDIVLQDQVILIIINFVSKLEVTRFKS